MKGPNLSQTWLLWKEDRNRQSKEKGPWQMQQQQQRCDMVNHAKEHLHLFVHGLVYHHYLIPTAGILSEKGFAADNTTTAVSRQK